MPPATRDNVWLLYAWCRAADDITDGQELGHSAHSPPNPYQAHRQLRALTAEALDGNGDVPAAFAGLREVVRGTRIPRYFIDDHLAGFELDAHNWRPEDTDDLLQYCYHVAGSVGCMMAVVMGVDPTDQDTLDRACDLGIAFQLANIARDLVADAQVGRCYVPKIWLDQFGLTETTMADPSNRDRLAQIASRLVLMARPYRASARFAAARLPARSRLAILTADAVYGAIGEEVVLRGQRAWDDRVYISGRAKLGLFGRALVSSARRPPQTPRTGLWTRPSHSG